MNQVFVSYPRRERARIEIVKRALEELGLSVFFDLDDIDGGDAFPDAIDEAVKGASAVFGCWTPYGLTRDWVKAECLIALDKKTLIPLEFEPLTSIDVPAAFFTLHRIDPTAWGGERNHESWLAAMRVLAQKLNRPEILDRAKARAAVGEDYEGLNADPDPDRMETLWADWVRRGTSKHCRNSLSGGGGTVVRLSGGGEQ